MQKWISRLLWIPALILGVLFLVANRQPVAISLDPFSANNPAVTTTALPLWFWLIIMLFAGFGLGAAGMWFSGAEGRKNARANRREVKSLRRDLKHAREKITSLEAAGEDRADGKVQDLLDNAAENPD